MESAIWQSELFGNRDFCSFRMRIHLRRIIVLQSRNSIAESSRGVANIIVLEDVFSFSHIFNVEISRGIFGRLIIT